MNILMPIFCTNSQAKNNIFTLLLKFYQGVNAKFCIVMDSFLP